MLKEGWRVVRATPGMITKEAVDQLEELFNSGFSKEKLKRVFSRERFCKSWYVFFQMQNTIMFLLLDKKDKIRGIMAGIAVFDTLTNNLLVTELAWRVRKPGTGGGKALYEYFESWAKLIGATRIILGGEVGEHEERAKQFYTDRGFEVTGFVVSKDLNGG